MWGIRKVLKCAIVFTHLKSTQILSVPSILGTLTIVLHQGLCDRTIIPCSKIFCISLCTSCCKFWGTGCHLSCTIAPFGVKILCIIPPASPALSLNMSPKSWIILHNSFCRYLVKFSPGWINSSSVVSLCPSPILGPSFSCMPSGLSIQTSGSFQAINKLTYYICCFLTWSGLWIL